MRVPNLATVVLSLCIAGVSAGSTDAAEDTGTVQQPIVRGDDVDVTMQKDLGLVTIGGGCSGTLVNQYWVLTADHCTASDGNIGGPSKAFASLRITSVWSTKVVTPTRLVRNWGPSPPGTGLDIALIFLGANDFGHVNVQQLAVDQIDHEVTIRKYGRGISVFATGSGAGATQATSDGLYRSGDFKPATSNATAYTVLPRLGWIPNGGDSGGPDRIITPDDQVLGIAGLQSTCAASGYVFGQPQNWAWATGISSCASAAIVGIREEIVEITRPEHVIFCKSYAKQAATEGLENQQLACGNEGSRWATNAAAHLDWCMVVNGDAGPANTETAARASALGPCREAVALRGQQEKKPSIPTGGLVQPVTPPTHESKPSGGTGGFMDQMRP